MIEVALFEICLSMLEKVTGFVKFSRSNKQEQFEKLITPFYEDMKIIHKNYLHIFAKVKRSIATNQDITEITQAFEEDRLDFSAIRGSVISLANVLSRKSNLKKYKAFFMVIEDYFTFYNEADSIIESKTDTGTVASEFLKKINEANTELTQTQIIARQKVLQELLLSLSNIIKHLESKWQKVSNRYAELMGDNI